MIEVTFRIESLDYTDKLDSQLPLVLEALSQSGNINPVLKLACNTPEACLLYTSPSPRDRG